MRLFIGVDGGGSSTKAAVATSATAPVAHANGPPSNPNNVGFPAAASAISETCEKLLSPFPENLTPSLTIALGIAGIGTADLQSEMRSHLNHYPLFKNASMAITHDLEIAYRAELGDSFGICVIIGTGSACFARAPENVAIRASGRSHGFDDPFSGFSIASRAAKTGLIETPGLDSHNRQATAALSALVFKSEKKAALLDLLHAEAALLAQLISKVESAARFSRAYPLVFVGGLSNVPLCRSVLLETLAPQFPKAKILFGKNAPVEGALQLAFAQTPS